MQLHVCTTAGDVTPQPVLHVGSGYGGGRLHGLLPPILEGARGGLSFDEGDGGSSFHGCWVEFGMSERMQDVLVIGLMFATIAVDTTVAAVSPRQENRWPLATFPGQTTPFPTLLQVLITRCSISFWAPALAFLASPTLAMAVVLLVNNGWMGISLRWFALLLLRSNMGDMNEVSGDDNDIL